MNKINRITVHALFTLVLLLLATGTASARTPEPLGPPTQITYQCGPDATMFIDLMDTDSLGLDCYRDSGQQTMHLVYNCGTDVPRQISADPHDERTVTLRCTPTDGIGLPGISPKSIIQLGE